jgi:hypothetical protein
MQENPFIYVMPMLNKLNSFCTQNQVLLKGDLKSSPYQREGMGLLEYEAMPAFVA